MDTQCKARNKDGEPCSANHYRDGWCYWHHPDLEAKRQAERAAGGKAKSNRRRARKKILACVLDLSEVDAAWFLALTDVLAGELEPGVGTAAASIARTITALRTATDHEERIAKLEAELGTSGKGIA